MGKVIVQAAMSLDGFIAHPSDDPGALFDWYSNGDVEATLGDDERVFHTTQASADYLRSVAEEVGADVIGRRLFDLTDGWKGRPAVGDAVFVVTHSPPDDWPYPDAPFTFVTDGLRSAVEQARKVAGDRHVGISAGDLGGQALEAGIVDEIRIDLVPVVFGHGVRFFGGFGTNEQLLENPTVVEGDRVTHLIYEVRRR